MKVHCKKLSESKHKKCPKIICRKNWTDNELEEFIKILADDEIRLQFH